MVMLWFSGERIMANTKVVLMCRVKTQNGWGHYRAAYSANGRVKPNTVIIDGREVKHTTGYYELRTYDGPKPVYESLKDTTPTEAEYRRKKKASELSARVIAKKAGVQVVPVDPRRKTLADRLKQFLADTLDRGSREAAEVYELACNEFLEVTGRQFSDEIVPEDITKFHKALTARGMSKRTVSNRHANVKAFLLFLGHDVKSLPKPPKFDKTIPEIFSDEELKALLVAVTTPRENLLFRFLLQTGAREREAMHAEWTDIDTEQGTVWFHSKPRWNFRMKDFEERSVPIAPDLMKRLKSYKKDRVRGSSLIFDKHGEPDGHMLRTLKQKVRVAGLNCERCDGCLIENPKRPRECENWYLHKFRATYCTKLLRTNKLDIRTVQQMMGHGDLASTMRYLRPAENVQTQAVISKMAWV